MGLTSPEAVTVCRSSGLISNLTVVTSASSLRLANTLIMITSASTATAATAIMIFFFFVKAIAFPCSGVKLLKVSQSIDFARKYPAFETILIRVTLTSKNRKQFQLRQRKRTQKTKRSPLSKVQSPMSKVCPAKRLETLDVGHWTLFQGLN